MPIGGPRRPAHRSFAFVFALSRAHRARTALRAASWRSTLVVRFHRARAASWASACRSSRVSRRIRAFPPAGAALASQEYVRRVMPRV